MTAFALRASLLLAGLSVGLVLTTGSTRAQDTDAPVTTLLRDLRSATAAGDRAAFDALVAPDAVVDPVARFAARWIVDATTGATLRERERRARDDGGQTLLVDALVEAGATGRVATWRLDVRPGEAGWRILDVATVGALEGLYRLGLEPDEQWRARNLVVRGEDFELRLPEGDVFVARAAGGITAAVLLGSGALVFSPRPDAEQHQLELFAGDRTLRTPWRAAFVRLNPANANGRLPPDQLTRVAVDPDAFQRAREVFAVESAKSFAVDPTGLSTASWSLLPPGDDLVAEIRTRRFDTLTYVQSSADAEDVSLFDRGRRKNIASYVSRARLETRGDRWDEDEQADYDVLHYDVDSRFTPETTRLDGTTRLRLRARTASTSTLVIRLADDLAVQSVTSDRYGRLLSLRVRGQNRLVVSLPEPFTRGTELAVTVRYAGSIAPQVIGRENLQTGQEGEQDPMHLPPVFAPPPIPLRVQPVWIYSNGTAWYPQAPVSDHATATIRITLPDGFGAACSGIAASGSPVALPAAPELPARRLFVFAADRPIPYLGCIVSRFRDDDAATLTVPVDGRADAAGPLTPVSIRLMNASRNRGRARDALETAGRIAAFYASLMEEVPYPQLTLATIESLVPGGHSPASLVILRQPLPQTPFVWGDDPAVFPGLDDSFLAHELAHQWWGQAVGWENYHEQWLSEGLAQYFTALYIEHDRGADDFRDVLRRLVHWTRSESDQGPVSLGYRVGHIRSDARAFRAVVYDKGAIVTHMLRLLVGDDAFVEGLRRFYRDQRFTKAGTADLRAAMESVSGQSLGPFFDAWIDGQQLPTVRAGWTTDGSTVRLTLRQEGNPIVFPLPVTIVHGDGSRTRHVLTVHGREDTFDIPVPGRIRTVEFNPDDTVPVDVRD